MRLSSEFRSRQTSARTGSTSVFPPLDSSGAPTAFPSEPAPGTNPGVLVGAQQAGETQGARPLGPVCPASPADCPALYFICVLNLKWFSAKAVHFTWKAFPLSSHWTRDVGSEDHVPGVPVSPRPQSAALCQTD